MAKGMLQCINSLKVPRIQIGRPIFRGELLVLRSALVSEVYVQKKEYRNPKQLAFVVW